MSDLHCLMSSFLPWSRRPCAPFSDCNVYNLEEIQCAREGIQEKGGCIGMESSSSQHETLVHRNSIEAGRNNNKHNHISAWGPILCWAVVFADMATPRFTMYRGYCITLCGQSWQVSLSCSHDRLMLLTFKYVDVPIGFPQVEDQLP